MLFGSVRKQPADPSFNLPARRRVIWEHAQDLAVFLRVNVIFNILFIISVVLVGVVVLVIVNRPPFVVNQDQGYVYYRNTEVYKLRTALIHSFVHATVAKLYTFSPGGYEIWGLESLISPQILEAFMKAARDEAEKRAEQKRRQFLSVREIRRYYDPKFDEFISIAVHGEKARFEEVITAEGTRELKADSGSFLIMTYLKEVVPSPENPWGLLLTGIFQVGEMSTGKAKLLWEASVPLGIPQKDAKKFSPAQVLGR